jgi:hypothetical protein
MSKGKTPQRLHLDRRAETILATAGGWSDDDLLTTPQMADHLGTSKQWLELGRSKGYGPPYLPLAPQIVRYRFGDGREWLKQRQYLRTADYPGEDRRRKTVSVK